MAKETIPDWFNVEFAESVLGSLPAPVSPVTNQKMWDKGVRLHGNQRGLILDNWRFKKGDGGIRFGKSYAPAVTILLDMLWRTNVSSVYDDLYGVVGSAYKMAEEEMNHLSRLLTQAGITHEFKTPKESSWEIRIPSIGWMAHTLTAPDVSRIASKPYRGMVLAEVGQLNEEVLDKAIGRVSERRGWVMGTGTFEKTKGPFSRTLTARWNSPEGLGVVYVCPSWDNPLVYPGGREDPEILARERTWPREKFLEVYGGEPSMPTDLVLPQARPEYIIKRRYPPQGTSYNPEQPVFLFSDPGTAHATAVHAVQFDWSDEYRDVYYELHRAGLSFGRLGEDSGNIAWVIDTVYRWNRETIQIINEVVNRPWATNVAALVIDFAARQRNPNGPPVVEQWAKFWREKMRRSLPIYADRVPLEDGYDVHRTALRNAWPEEAAQAAWNSDGALRSVIDPAGLRLQIDPRCRAVFFGGVVDGTEWAGEYLLHKNQRNSSGSIISDVPRDENNDAIKAMNYGLYWWAGPGRTKHKYSNVYSLPWQMVS